MTTKVPNPRLLKDKSAWNLYSTNPGVGPGRWDSSKLARDQERAADVSKLVEAWS